MGTILIKHGTLVTETGCFVADVRVEGERISAIDTRVKGTADQEIDASGCYVIPGGIDGHTHLDMPYRHFTSSDTVATGTLAALHGGTTSIIDFATQEKGGTLSGALSRAQTKAQGSAYCDFGFHVAVTDLHERSLAEVEQVVKHSGVTSFKVYMAYKDLMLRDDDILRLLREARRWGAIVGAHCENGDVVNLLVAEHVAEKRLLPKYHPLARPAVIEEEATGRFLDLAWLADCPSYVVHVTTEGALRRAQYARARGQKVYVETCPQYLTLDVSLYDRGLEGAKWVVSPPLRREADRQALWHGMHEKLVDMVGTDHCPFMWEHKKLGASDFSLIPGGIGGIEHRVELLHSEGVLRDRISLSDWVCLTSTRASRIFGLYPQKGVLAVGSDADIVIFDLFAEHVISAQTHHMKCDYSAYEGYKLRGKCRTVLLRGAIVIDRAKATVSSGFGRYLFRKPMIDSRS